MHHHYATAAFCLEYGSFYGGGGMYYTGFVNTNAYGTVADTKTNSHINKAKSRIGLW